MRAGKGDCDASISSLGMGLMTFSLLERSSAAPIGDVSFSSPVIGSWALRESSDISVIAKTPPGLSWAKAGLARLNTPISVDAVEATMIASCRLGGKSFSRRKKWCGGERFRPKGPAGSEIFWNRKLEGGVRVTIWKTEDGASLLLKFDGV